MPFYGGNSQKQRFVSAPSNCVGANMGQLCLVALPEAQPKEGRSIGCTTVGQEEDK